MPCYEIRTLNVEFKAAHADLLDKAMDALNMTRSWLRPTFCRLQNGIELDLQTGRANIPSGQQDKLNELKRAYSMEALKQVAKANRWQVAKTKAGKGQLIKTYL